MPSMWAHRPDSSDREVTFLLLPINLVLNCIIHHPVTGRYILSTVIAICLASCSILLSMQTPKIISVVTSSTIVYFIASKVLNSPFGFNDFLFVRLLAGFIMAALFSYAHKRFPRSFSVGELSLFMQGTLTFLAISVPQLIVPSYDAVAPVAVHTSVVQILSIGCAFFMGNCLTLHRRDHPEYQTGPVVGAFVAAIIFSYMSLVKLLYPVEPFTWLIRCFSTVPTSLVTTWVVSLGSALVFCTILTKMSTDGQSASTGVRKVFHLLIGVVFVTGMVHHPTLLSFATSSLFLVLVVLELFRVTKIDYISDYLDMAVNTFRDKQDQGDLTLTHIYLLVGCSVPLWIYPSSVYNSLSPFTGIISIGIGDAAASIVGSSLGSHRWFGTKKTVEGVVANVLAQSITCVVLWNQINPGLVITMPEVICLVVISAGSSIVEATSREIDNLVCPFYTNIFLLMAKCTLFPRL